MRNTTPTFDDAIAAAVARALDEHYRKAVEPRLERMERALRAQPRQLLTPTQAAALLGVHVKTLHVMVRDGRIRGVGKGHSLRIDPASLAGPTDGEVDKAARGAK